MSIARKLALLLALAIAAIAATASPAFATGANTATGTPTDADTSTATVTPTGTYTLTEHDPFTISNGVVTITCTTSSLTATMQEDGTFTITAFSFTSSCEENLFFTECSPSVESLPANGSITFGTPRSSWRQTTAVEEFTFPCGGDTPVHCNASTTDTLGGTIANRTEPTESNTEPEFTIEDGTVAIDVLSAQCGTTATLNASWTIDGIYTITL